MLKTRIAIIAFVLTPQFGELLAQNRFPLSGNVGINLGSSTAANKLQIGSNPQGWSGNDLVISGDATRGAIAMGSSYWMEINKV